MLRLLYTYRYYFISHNTFFLVDKVTVDWLVNWLNGWSTDWGQWNISNKTINVKWNYQIIFAFSGHKKCFASWKLVEDKDYQPKAQFYPVENKLSILYTVNHKQLHVTVWRECQGKGGLFIRARSLPNNVIRFKSNMLEVPRGKLWSRLDWKKFTVC